MNVFDLIAPHPDPLSIRLGAAVWSNPDQAQAARDRRTVEIVGKAVYRQRFEAKDGNDRSAWLLRKTVRKTVPQTSDVGEVGQLVDRVGAVNTRLRGGGYGTDQLQMDRFTAIIYVAVILWLATMTARCVVEHQTKYVFAMGGFLLAIVAYFAVVLAWMDGYRRAIWLGSADALRAERVALARAEELRAQAEAPCDLTIALPRQVPGEGFLYVIQFSAGAVKVGMSEDPRRRISEHRRDADAFKVAITNFWISPSHRGFRNTEVALINRCAKVSSRVRREYFHEITFSAAVDIATQLTNGGTR